MKVAVFPGSFDPFTNGHLEVVQEGLRFFDRLVVGIGSNSSKGSFFSVEERLEMISGVIPDGCFVKSFEGLVVDFARAEGACALIRGLRTESDFSYEMPMAVTNRILEPALSTIFIPTSQKNNYLSSTLVREVALHKGDVSSFVPQIVGEHIAQKIG